MNHQMNQLEARAVAREREHQTQPGRHGGAARPARRWARRAYAPGAALPSLRRQPAVAEAGSRSTHVATVRG